MVERLMMQGAIRKKSDEPETVRFDGIVYRKAAGPDNEVIQSVLNATPMSSWLVLSTRFRPDYFAAKHLFGNKETILACDDENGGSPVGMCAYTSMPVHVNGHQATVGYLGELRVLPAYRHKLRVLRNGFSAVHIFSKDNIRIADWYTSIASDNHAARRILEARVRGMPGYRPLGEMLTFALPAKGTRKNDRFLPATAADIPEISRFYNREAKNYQYAPVLTEKWLGSLDGGNGLRIEDFYILKGRDGIRACFALWDQRKIKQTVVLGYRFPIGVFRKIYNLYAGLTGRVMLPAVGESINYIFIAFIALDAATQTEFKNMISDALVTIKSRGAKLGMLGLAMNNPLARELDNFAKQTYRTCIERVTWQDIAGGKGDNLHPQDMIVQPEIAIL